MTRPERILFVCTGNLCRSPMAEGLAEALWPGRHSFESAGVYAMDGAPASGHAVTAAAELGGDLSGHRARRLTPELGRSVDRIYVMAGHHLAEVLAIDPSLSDRTRLLDPAGRDIADPYGSALRDYRRARDEILSALEARAVEWGPSR